jgi:hypothetical protein
MFILVKKNDVLLKNDKYFLKNIEKYLFSIKKSCYFATFNLKQDEQQ